MKSIIGHERKRTQVMAAGRVLSISRFNLILSFRRLKPSSVWTADSLSIYLNSFFPFWWLSSVAIDSAMLSLYTLNSTTQRVPAGIVDYSRGFFQQSHPLSWIALGLLWFRPSLQTHPRYPRNGWNCVENRRDNKLHLKILAGYFLSILVRCRRIIRPSTAKKMLRNQVDDFQPFTILSNPLFSQLSCASRPPLFLCDWRSSRWDPATLNSRVNTTRYSRVDIGGKGLV